MGRSEEAEGRDHTDRGNHWDKRKHNLSKTREETHETDVQRARGKGDNMIGVKLHDVAGDGRIWVEEL